MKMSVFLLKPLGGQIVLFLALCVNALCKTFCFDFDTALWLLFSLWISDSDNGISNFRRGGGVSSLCEDDPSFCF